VQTLKAVGCKNLAGTKKGEKAQTWVKVRNELKKASYGKRGKVSEKLQMQRGKK